MSNESHLNPEEKKYLQSVKHLFSSAFAPFTPGKYTLQRWYPIGLILATFLLTLVGPLYILSLTKTNLALAERTLLAQFILVFSVAFSSLSIFYYKAIVQKSLLFEKDGTLVLNNQPIIYCNYQYIRFYTAQTSKYGENNPSMIVFSNIKNDIWRFLIASYFPFWGNTLVMHIYKVKNAQGQKVESACLVDLIQEQSKKHQFHVSEKKGLFAIGGWMANRNFTNE